MTLTNSKNYKQRGFTIVELLIVIIVIGILATLVLIAYNNVQGQARDTKRQADANSLKEASTAFKTQISTGYYPQIYSSNGGTPVTLPNATGTAAQNGGNNTGSSGANFQADLATLSPATVTVDPAVSANINASNSVNNSVPGPSNPNYIQVLYCLAGAPSGQQYNTDRTAATGMKFVYYSEIKKTTGYVTDGSGC